MSEKREMTARDYFEYKATMTGLDDKGRCTIKCRTCPISSNNNNCRVGCRELESIYPWRAIELVQKWAEEHPVKTIAEDFFEKFPNAPKDEDVPKPCAKHCGYVDDCPEGVTCNECWKQPLEVKE